MELQRFVELAREHGRLGIDVEFIQERTYYPKLALVQLAAADECALVDPLAIDDLSAVESAIADDALVKVLHAGSQDLAIFFERSGQLPRHVFDTQVAAAMVGMGDQIGFGPLVERVTGTRLAKSESFTDWLQRPLTTSQERYALDDVRYLFALHDHLEARLEELGRANYVREECARFEQRTYFVADEANLYRKVKRFSHLDPRGQAILRELARWREQTARERNKPRGWIVADEVLLEAARRRITEIGALGKLRAVKPQTLRDFGEEIVAEVERGLRVPEADWPGVERRAPLPTSAGLGADLLNVILKAACHEASIAPSMVGTTADVQSLVRAHLAGDGSIDDVPLLQGWRGELAGHRLKAFLAGELSASIDARTLAPTVEVRADVATR